jgi:hypothetical protein
VDRAVEPFAAPCVEQSLVAAQRRNGRHLLAMSTGRISLPMKRVQM